MIMNDTEMDTKINWNIYYLFNYEESVPIN